MKFEMKILDLIAPCKGKKSATYLRIKALQSAGYIVESYKALVNFGLVGETIQTDETTCFAQLDCGYKVVTGVHIAMVYKITKL